MKRQVKLTKVTLAFYLMLNHLVSAQSFDSLKSLETFVGSSSWQLIVREKVIGDVDFAPNHTLPAGKAVKLGNKLHRFWSVKAHPTAAGKYFLRIHSKKSAGWYSFSWNSSKQAWVSKNWPKHQIKKK